MGRQLSFYMLPEDQSAFLHFAQDCGPTAIILRDADSAAVQPLAHHLDDQKHALCLWNRDLLPHLERKWVPDPGYFRVDGLRTPTLEFIPSFSATWEGKLALGQGRLFGDFDASLGKPREFEKWYKHLIHWIRKSYRKSATSTGGYLAPAADEFFNKGGYLLPQFLPPPTKEWLSEIRKQH